MRLRHAVAIGALMFVALPAQAQEQCGPLARAFQLDLTPGPGGARYSVPIMVNGKPRQFLLDTGNPNSRLGRSVVTELSLSTKTGGRMLAPDGSVAEAYVTEADLEIGPMKAPRHEMWVQEGLTSFGGIFAPDLMQNYDIEIDFAGRKLSYFLPDHCPGRVVHWATTGMTAVDFTGWDNNSNRRAMTVTVQIDGKDVLAQIDTGLAQTVLDADTAKSVFDLTADSPNTTPMGALSSNPAHRIFGYTFQTLKMGGMTIRNPRLRVVPDLIGTGTVDTLRADSRVRRRTDEFLPTVQLGMDVLSRLHLYIEIKEKKLHFTAANAGRAGSPPPAAPPPAQPGSEDRPPPIRTN
jgi:predicted aspartyl protease